MTATDVTGFDAIFSTASPLKLRGFGPDRARFCQTYVLQSGAFHENDGNHENDENDEDNSDSHKQVGRLLDLRKSRKARKWRKPRESKVQNIGSPKPRFRKTRLKAFMRKGDEDRGPFA